MFADVGDEDDNAQPPAPAPLQPDGSAPLPPAPSTPADNSPKSPLQKTVAQPVATENLGGEKYCLFFNVGCC